MKKILSGFKNIFTIKDHPDKIAKGFALGSFIGMMPIPGLQVLVALGVSTLLKINKKAACVAVFNTNLATGAFVFAFNYWLGKQLLGITSTFVIPDEMGVHFISTILKAGSEVFIALMFGGVVTGSIAALIAYVAVKSIIHKRYDKLSKDSQIQT